MRQIKQLSWAMLALVFACETDVGNQAGLVYNTNQQVISTETFLVDFETYNPGDLVSEIVLTDPFVNPLVAGITMAFPNENSAMVFDSSNPTGGDFDIGTPNEIYGGPGRGDGGVSNDTALGNVLILSEDLDPSDPDDIFEIGASFVFDFSANDGVVMESFDILDIEVSQNPTVVNLYDSKGEVLLSKTVEPGGDNSKSNVDLENTSDVAIMELVMNSSGAIDNLIFSITSEEVCVDCDGNIVQLTFKNNSSDDSEIRVETSDGSLVFEGLVAMDDTFTISGNELDGSFSGNLLVFVNNNAPQNLATDCSQVVGPGLLVGSLEVVSGKTSNGGSLCPVQVAF